MDLENKHSMRSVLYILLSKIPYGHLVTYGQLARMTGHPGAARDTKSLHRKGDQQLLTT